MSHLAKTDILSNDKAVGHSDSCLKWIDQSYARIRVCYAYCDIIIIAHLNIRNLL